MVPCSPVLPAKLYVRIATGHLTNALSTIITEPTGEAELEPGGVKFMPTSQSSRTKRDQDYMVSTYRCKLLETHPSPIPDDTNTILSADNINVAN